MNLKITAIASAFLLVSATTALAAPQLTSQQCNDFPFKQPVGEITHAQLEQQLAELEAIGYYPGSNDVYYPRDLQAAQRKLRSEYRHDCSSQSNS